MAALKVEAKICGLVSHPHVVGFYNMFISPEQAVLVGWLGLSFPAVWHPPRAPTSNAGTRHPTRALPGCMTTQPFTIPWIEDDGTLRSRATFLALC